jgi:hypothetical protein
MSLKSTALAGFLERLMGGRATRAQALVSGIAAGVAVYKLLRSGADDAEQDEASEPEGAA